jgi:branched-chain amino acid transport system ATP-binding protein
MKTLQQQNSTVELPSSREKVTPCLFSVQGVHKKFGGIQALFDVTMQIEKQEIVSMIGPNGAGKSTFINVVTGVYAPDEGYIRFQNKDIAGLPAHVIASFGIGRTFQLEELFPSLSVLENAMVGCHIKGRSGMLASGLRIPSATKERSGFYKIGRRIGRGYR